MTLVRILNWHHDTSSKLWVPLEKLMAGMNLAGPPWIPSTSRGLSDWTFPLTRSTLNVWDRLNRTNYYAPPTSLLVPLGVFPWCRAWILLFMGKFIWAPYRTLLPLQVLQSSYGTFPFMSWRHCQLTDFISKLDHKLRSTTCLTMFESMCEHLPDARYLLF